MIESITLKNFTVFRELSINFSSKINVIIGENGTGKSHLLKAAYGLCTSAKQFNDKQSVASDALATALTDKFLRLFLPMNNKLGKLRRHGVAENASMAVALTFDKQLEVSFHTNSKNFAIQNNRNYERYSWSPVFIPTKEVLSLVKGMTDNSHDRKTVELIFDDGYVDLANALMQSGQDDIEDSVNINPRLNEIIPELVNLIGGRYQWNRGGFCFQPGKYVEKASPKRSKAKSAQMYQDSTITEFVPEKGELYSSAMTAEGFRKVGILHQLLSNGTLNPGVSGPLFWDEPESNMNPKLIKILVEALLKLSRNGQQIILATHDYVLLKWFNLLMDKGKGDHVVYHALYRGEKGEIILESTNDYYAISPNAISDTFNDLTREQVNKKMRGLGR